MKAKVVLFKASGKYYTEEEWEVPNVVPDWSPQRGEYTRPPLLPVDMEHSPDFRRIDNGAVLVPDQEPWGYPHLLPAPAGVSPEISAVLDAWRNEGPKPLHHRMMRTRLQAEWPVLYVALARLDVTIR